MTYEEAKELKEGDIVSCNISNVYSITDVGVPCEFVRIYDPALEGEIDDYDTDGEFGIVVKVIATGHCYGVIPECFSRVYEMKEVQESELMTLM